MHYEPTTRESQRTEAEVARAYRQKLADHRSTYGTPGDWTTIAPGNVIRYCLDIEESASQAVVQIWSEPLEITEVRLITEDAVLVMFPPTERNTMGFILLTGMQREYPPMVLV